MKERRRIIGTRQLELLLKFVKEHKDLTLGKVRTKEARSAASQLWVECAKILNAEGPARTPIEWSMVWNDQKCKVRSKLNSINASQRVTGKSPFSAPVLSPIEEKIANMLGQNVESSLDVSQDQFSSSEDDEENMEQVNSSEPMWTNLNETQELYQQFPGRIIVSPVPSLSGQVPISDPAQSDRSRRWPRRRRVRTRQLLAQLISSRRATASASKESIAMILQIERTEADTTLKYAEGFKVLSESLHLLATSIDRLSKKYCQTRDAKENCKPTLATKLNN